MLAAATDHRTAKQKEADARKITCQDCHAPAGIGCVAIAWSPVNGAFVPRFVDREYHRRRLKWADKAIKKFGDIR